MTNITSGAEGSFFFSMSGSIAFAISSCTIECRSTQLDLTVVDPLLNANTNDIGVAFYFNGAFSVTSTSNIFQNCYVTDKGSIFAIYNTKLTETGSTY